MPDDIRLKEKYVLARCCAPSPGDPITGYFSHDDLIKVHRSDCSNLTNTDQERLVVLAWEDILAESPAAPDRDFEQLEENDFLVLRHHRDYGVDYSLKAAAVMHLPKQEVFDRHRKLREMGLLERVKPVMIQYRKGIVDNKWIKHRNHTYYELTQKGRQYLEHFLNGNNS